MPQTCLRLSGAASGIILWSGRLYRRCVAGVVRHDGGHGGVREKMRSRVGFVACGGGSGDSPSTPLDEGTVLGLRCMGIDPGRSSTTTMALPVMAGFFFNSESRLGDGASSAHLMVATCISLRSGDGGGTIQVFGFVCSGTSRDLTVFLFLLWESSSHIGWDFCPLSCYMYISTCGSCTPVFVANEARSNFSKKTLFFQ